MYEYSDRYLHMQYDKEHIRGKYYRYIVTSIFGERLIFRNETSSVKINLLVDFDKLHYCNK